MMIVPPTVSSEKERIERAKKIVEIGRDGIIKTLIGLGWSKESANYLGGVIYALAVRVESGMGCNRYEATRKR